RYIQEHDYNHHKQDGTVDKIADSMRVEFKTKSGRKVYDGGGLNPDVEVKTPFLGTVTLALLNSGLIFEYASKYCTENPAQPNLKTFRISEEEYQKFVTWLNEHKFNYTTPLEQSTNELIEAAKQDRYYPQLKDELSDLKTKIETNKSTDLNRFKTEIVEYLEEQIAFHYGLAEGQAQISLARDQEIVEA